MSAQPHDALFKAVFSDPINAEAELRALLSPELASTLVAGSLVLEPGSFVDEELRATHADLLFRARFTGGEGLVYVLLEHQAAEDRWMPVRIARYVLRIWEREIERDPRRESLPAVIPVFIRELVVAGDLERALTIVVRYLVSVRPNLDLDALARSADTIALGAGEPIMSTARQLIEKGIEQGIAQGLARGAVAGRRETLQRLLERRFGKLTEQNASRLSNATAEEIDRWVDRVLDASSIEDVLS